MKVLLTGGSGMVGRNFLDRAFGQTGITLLSPNRAEMNLLSYDSVKSYIAVHNPDIVIHAAGRVGGIQANMQDQIGFYTDNLDMGRNLVLACHRQGIPRLLNLGSSCMYPRDRPSPLAEQDLMTGQLEPTNEGYALAKLSVAKLCQFVSTEGAGKKYQTVIPCNLYGRYDHFASDRSHLVPAAIAKIINAQLRGDATVTIWGDGTARREFMFAGDLADFLIEAVVRFDEVPDLMNVGVGQDHSVRDYYEATKQVLNWAGDFLFDTTKPVGMARKLVSIDRQTKFGWRPKTSLIDGLVATAAYYQEVLTNAT